MVKAPLDNYRKKPKSYTTRRNMAEAQRARRAKEALLRDLRQLQETSK
jgi:hypothetical protein